MFLEINKLYAVQTYEASSAHPKVKSSVYLANTPTSFVFDRTTTIGLDKSIWHGLLTITYSLVAAVLGIIPMHCVNWFKYIKRLQN